MRKQSYFLIAFLSFSFFIQSCDFQTDGVGDPITEEFTLDEFDEFTIDGSMDVKLTQGAEQKVLITAQPNILDLIRTRVSNGHWKITYTRSVNLDRKTIVEITVPDIRRMEIDGSGDIIGQNDFDLDNLDIRIDGSGDVELFGQVENQLIEIDGSGNVDNFDLISQKTTVIIDGSGDVEVTAEDKLEVEISGSGDVIFKGNPDLDIKVDGSGEVTDGN